MVSIQYWFRLCIFLKNICIMFLCIAVYKDATEKNNKNAVLWTILTPMFGGLPGIIYLFSRNEKGQIDSEQKTDGTNKKSKLKVNVYFIVSIVLIIIRILLAVWIVNFVPGCRYLLIDFLR